MGVHHRRIKPRSIWFQVLSVLMALALAGCQVGIKNKGADQPSGSGTQTTGTPPPVPQKKVDSITISINTSPWLDAVKKVAEMYEHKGGSKVIFNTPPFTELFQKNQRAVATGSNEYDLIAINEEWTGFFYGGGFVAPILEIDPNFKLDAEVLSIGNIGRWHKEKRFTTEDGVLYGVPLTGMVKLLWYRTDIYEEAGLKPPQTWENVLAAAKKLHNPDKGLYGYAIRGARGEDIVNSFIPILMQFGGNLWMEPGKNWRPAFDQKPAKDALTLFVELGKYSPPNKGTFKQNDVVNALSSGSAVQAEAVAATYYLYDDPKTSKVVGKIGVAPMPAGSGGQSATTGGFALTIPNSLPMERKKAALDFLRFFLSKEAQMEYAKAKGIPVRQDVYEELSNEEPFRYMKAVAASRPFTYPSIRIPESPKIVELLGLKLNQALIGELSVDEALQAIQTGMIKIMQEGGYQ